MKVKEISKKKLLGKPLKVEAVTFRYEQFDGEMSGKVEKVIVRRNDAVSAVVYNTDTQQYIFVSQFRYSAYRNGENGWLTELMAGVIDKDETPEDALVRELEEELGYTTDKAEKITSFFTAPGYTTEQVHLYYVEVSNASKSGKGGGVEDEHENIEPVSYSLEEIREIMEAHTFNDAKTIIGCNYVLNSRAEKTGEKVKGELLERPWPNTSTL